MLLILYHLTSRVLVNSMFGLLYPEKRLACLIHRKNPFWFCDIIHVPTSCCKKHCLLVASNGFNWPYAYSRYILGILNGSFCTVDIPLAIWFGKASRFEIGGLIFTEQSFNFLESNAINTDSSFFSISTKRDKKQFSFTLCVFSRCPVVIDSIFFFSA